MVWAFGRGISFRIYSEVLDQDYPDRDELNFLTKNLQFVIDANLSLSKCSLFISDFPARP